MDIKVVELFAGVGGFRLGLENSSDKFKTIWANQWEPSKKVQHAYNCYISHYHENGMCINEDISAVKSQIPEHDLLVGGFPCQDYSVASTQAKGLEGKKGVLWWEINDIVKAKKPQYIILENVDRLLKSPSSQRGRDFAIILRCLNDLGYAVEWRVINAAEYGFAQRRRRTFIFAYKNTTNFFKTLSNKVYLDSSSSFNHWLTEDGFFAKAFPVVKEDFYVKTTDTCVDEMNYEDLAKLSSDFEAQFFNSGIMLNGHVYSIQTKPIEYKPITLGEIRTTDIVDPRFFLNGSLDKWTYLKGAKRIERIRPNGEPYTYSEGGMCLPDNLDAPSRTMLTSESSVNRSTHVIEDSMTGNLRLLTPIECERLNGFPDNWTDTGMPEKFRYFVMGNSLVVPVITQIGNRLLEIMQVG